ncbi:MAG: hypothetical protein ABI442_09625 [Gemmatimonadaceae bacterium]
MFGSVMLDVAIGLILVYLILSLACTALRELFEVFLKNRAGFLHQGITELLHDPALTKDLYEHPLINSLYHSPYEAAKKARDLPSYIPSRSFALAVLDMAARGRDSSSASAAGLGAPVMSIATIRQNISLIGNSKVQRVILSAIDTSEGELENVQLAIETWFNSSMDRVSGWYKRRSQLILIVLGIAIAGIVNVDTMRLALSFYADPSQRQAAVAMAGSVLKEPPAGVTQPVPGAPAVATNPAEVASLWTHLDSLSLPIGWPDPGFGLMRLFGWLLTGLAVSLGAPFWFDLLGKVMTVRSTLKPKSTSSSDAPPKSGDSNVTIVSPAAAPAAVAIPVGAVTPASVASLGAPGPGADYEAHEWSSGHAQEGVI